MAKLVKLGLFTREHKVCGSTIEFALTELKEDYHQDYLGDRDYYRYIVCPACGKQMLFPQYGEI